VSPIIDNCTDLLESQTKKQLTNREFMLQLSGSKGNFGMEKYSSGRRGAPAKGVGRETGAGVQIPASPPPISQAQIKKYFKIFF